MKLEQDLIVAFPNEDDNSQLLALRLILDRDYKTFNGVQV